MNFRFVFLTAFAILFAPFCFGQDVSKPVIMDFDKALKDERVLKLSDIADSIKYIKLETSDDCLVNRASVLATDDLIFVKVSKPGRILVFDHSGKHLYDIGKYGQGPGEYGALSEWAISPDQNYLALQDFYNFGTHIFTIKGEYVTKIKSDVTMFDGLAFTDKNTLIRFTNQDSHEGGRFRFEEIDIPSLETKKHVWKQNNNEPQKQGEIGLSEQCFIDLNNVYYSEVLNDTLFALDKNGQLIPSFLYKLGKKKWPRQNITREEMEKYHHPTGLSVTSDFLFMNLLAGKGKGRTMAYQKSSNEFFTIKPFTDCPVRENSYSGVENDMDGIQPYTVLRSGHGNNWASLLQITMLDEYKEKGCWNDQDLINPKYRIKLQELLENSDIEDNPIVRIVYLK